MHTEFPKGYKAACNQCQATFTSKISRLNHFKYEHGKDWPLCYLIRLCGECFFVAQNCSRSFKRHKEYHKLSHVYRCNECWFLCETIGGIRKHVNVSLRCSMRDVVEIKDGVSTPFSFPPR